LAPSAILKAEALARFVKTQGSPIKEFAVAITDAEGYELLDYLMTRKSDYANGDLLVQDIVQARTQGNPWIVLDHWNLLGLDLMRVDELH